MSLEKHTFYILTDLQPNVRQITKGGTVTASYKEHDKPKVHEVEIYVTDIDRRRGLIRGTTVPRGSRDKITHVEVTVTECDLRVVDGR